MEEEIHSDEIGQIRELADVLSGMIKQFMKTREELMRTTLQAQIELLTGRLKRLEISITEIKSQIDASCIPEEAKLVEEETGDKVRPYIGAEMDKSGNIEEFSWKSKHTLEIEKEQLLRHFGNALKDIVEKVYTIYITRSVSLCGIEEKSRLK